MNDDMTLIADEKCLKCPFNGIAKTREAQRWINVKEELPNNQDIVLVKTDNGCVSIAYLHRQKSVFIVYGVDAYIKFGNIVSWRPIEGD